MSEDLRVAVSVALLIFSGLLSLVTTGAVTIPPRVATDLRARRWRWAPVALVAASALSALLLPSWPSRVICLAAAGIAAGGLLEAKPRSSSARRAVGRRAFAPRDSRQVLRIALVFTAWLVFAVGVFVGMVASQA